jgi:iron complex transport system ATP-binding protein
MSRLEARSCSVILGRRQVLHAVHCRLEPGFLVGVIGPNGAGKSTLVRALAGILPSPDVFLNQRPLADFSAAKRAQQIAYLPQNTPAPWPMPCRDVVSLGRLPHRDGSLSRGQQAIERAMERANVLDLAERPLTMVSGGERARVGLARALAVEAPILLADEPIAHLEPAHQLQSLELLRTRADAGDAVMVVLHDLSLAARFCDSVVVIEKGTIVANGPPDVVMNDDLLRSVFGISTARSTWQGRPFLLPWQRVAS